MQLLPSHDAVSLITVLPEQLQSPLLTAEWEYRLGEIERGQLAPEEFLDGISIPFKGKPFAHPIRYGCFLHGAISLDIATGILSILPPILTGSPVSLIPARSVLPAMSPGSAWEEAQPGCFAPGGLGGNDGREGGPSLSFAQAC